MVRGEVMGHPLSCCDVRDEVLRPDARCVLGAPGWLCSGWVSGSSRLEKKVGMEGRVRAHEVVEACLI